MRRLIPRRQVGPDWRGPVCTRGGTPVTMLTFEGRGAQPLVGYIGDADTPSSWTEDGAYSGRPSPFDLFEAEEQPLPTTLWLLFDKNAGTFDGSVYETHPGTKSGFLVVKVTVDA